MSKFGNFLKSKAINKKDLADLIGLNPVTVRQHAKGNTPISLESARKYADFFNIDYKEFVNRFVL